MARFATYYFRYKHDFGPHDWDDRQKHLGSLFVDDKSIVFGQGDPTEEQKAQRIPYRRVFDHRVYHLKANPNIIVMQIANSIDIPLENKFEERVVRDEPSLFVIIDNREGMRAVAIQNRQRAFSAPKRVADMMAAKISSTLYREHCYSLQILPEYYPEDLFKAWEEQQERAMALSFPTTFEMSDEEIMQKVAELKTQGKSYFDDTFIPMMLGFAAEGKRAQYKDRLMVMPANKNTALYVDKTSSYMKNLITLARAANEPVEIIVKGGTKFRCFVESDDDNTDKIVHHSFDDRLLAMLFNGRKPGGEEASAEEMAKAEGMVVEMMNGMKHESEDAEEEDVA